MPFWKHQGKGKGKMQSIFHQQVPLENAERHHAMRPAEVIRITGALKEHFSFLSRWEFEDIISVGNSTITARIKNKRHGLQRHHRIAVKRGLTNFGDQEIIIEIFWLARTSGAEHIASMLAYCNELDIPTTSTSKTHLPLKDRLFSKDSEFLKPFKDLFGVVNYEEELELREFAPYPVIIMEYMEWGTLKRLIDRAVHYHTAIPNRILWAFFLCLVRACIGLAYPPGAPLGQKTQIETIPADGTPASNVVHGLLNLSNIMISDGDVMLVEHARTPAVKLIDLGNTAEAHDNLANRYNLWDISAVMMSLITRSETWGISPSCVYRGMVTQATPILNENRENYPLLDDDLRDLLARCLAQNPDHRPNLRDLLAEVGHVVWNKSVDQYPWYLQAYETDLAIRTYLKHCVYDAAVIPEEERPNTANEELPQPPPPPKTPSGPQPKTPLGPQPKTPLGKGNKSWGSIYGE